MPSPSQIIGAAQEAHAERALVAAGYRIIARNWRGSGGEIDRIAWDGEVLVFVEIRARSTSAHGEPSETVRFPKRRRLIRAAIAYLARLPEPRLPTCRFDVVSIVGHEAPRVQIIPDAFDSGERTGSRTGPML